MLRQFNQLTNINYKTLVDLDWFKTIRIGKNVVIITRYALNSQLGYKDSIDITAERILLSALICESVIISGKSYKDYTIRTNAVFLRNPATIMQYIADSANRTLKLITSDTLDANTLLQCYRDNMYMSYMKPKLNGNKYIVHININIYILRYASPELIVQKIVKAYNAYDCMFINLGTDITIHLYSHHYATDKYLYSIYNKLQKVNLFASKEVDKFIFLKFLNTENSLFSGIKVENIL